MYNSATAFRPNLSIPFGALTAAGSYLLIASISPHMDARGLAVAGVAIPTAIAVAIGLWFSLRARRGRVVGWLELISTLLAGGVVSGAAVGLVGPPNDSAPLLTFFGAIFGFFVTLPLLPTLVVAFSSWGAIGRARVGSVIDMSDRQRLWVATTAGLSLYALGMLQSAGSTSMLRLVGLYVAFGSVFVAGCCLYSDIQRSLSLRRVTRGLVASPEARFDSQATVDLGLGHETWAAVLPSQHPYRSSPTIISTVLGSTELVSAALRKSSIFSGITLAWTLIVLLSAASSMEKVKDTVIVDQVAVAAAVPAKSCAHYSWYSSRSPIVVDVNGDGVEDIVGLRWNSSQKHNSLAVTATDGASLKELWCKDGIASQWGSPHTRLIRSDQTLYLTDSEGLMHLYSLSTGDELTIVSPIPVPEIVDACAADEHSLWYSTGHPYNRGLVVRPDGRIAAADRPTQCGKQQPPLPATCTTWPNSLGSRIMPVPTSQPKGRAVYVRNWHPTSANPKGATAPEVSAVNPTTCESLWRLPIAFGGDPLHLHPQLEVMAHSDKIYSYYQLLDGAWRLGARRGETGEVLWVREPTRTDRGSSFHSMSATDIRLYLMLEWRLDIFDAETGAPIGTIP